MESSGVKIDPISGRPVKEESREGKVKAEEERQETLLKSQAAWQRVSQTEAGKNLLAMITEKLENRVAALVKDDAESQAYMKILTEMGVKEGVASAAVKTLMAKSIKRKET